MPYEFFVGWRYLHRGKTSKSAYVVLAAALCVLGIGLTLFFWPLAADRTRTYGTLLMLVGGLGSSAALLLVLFSTFTAVAILGIAIGVSILIWVLSVTSGFQEEFRRKVLGVNAHVLILKYGIDFAEYPKVIEIAERTAGVQAAAPFLFNEMMLARGNHLAGVLVKGVDPSRVGRVLDLPRHIDEPKRPPPMHRLLTQSMEGGASPTIIVGRELARRLDAHVGDAVRLVSPLSGLDIGGWSAEGEMPRSRDFRIGAIFYSGFDEYDKRLVYVHMREAQAFFDQGDVVTGVELKLDDVYGARAIARRVAARLGGSPYRTVDWGELNRNLFTALNMQKIFLEIVIGFIVVVAAFNVLAALAMLVIRKTREIAILKSMGMSSWGIARIFQSAGVIVWLVGTSLGLLLGYLGGLILERYGFPLDPKVYLINRLPVRMSFEEFLVTAGFALVVCVLATLYPAIRAAHMNPVEGLTK